MTIGWGWGRTACGRGNNHILANKIANSNLARCCDGGQVILSPPNCRPQKRMAVASVTLSDGQLRAFECPKPSKVLSKIVKFHL